MAAATALAAAAGAAFLAAHHPLSPATLLAACALLAALTTWQPGRWPLWLLPLWPLIGLMTWTGWIVVEEFDIAVLAVAAGGYARLAFGWPRERALQATRRPLALLLVLTPLLLSTLLSMQRGLDDAGGFSLGWWQGYREPLNSVRLAKPILEVLLLLPLWRASCRASPGVADASLRLGVQLLLLGVALAVVWERVAFTGLLDFSSDYRATGPFWEMHVGGAALDAALALATPFAVAGLVRARAPLRWAAAATVLALAMYAALVTFSRIVYLALPLGASLWWGLRAAAAGRAALASALASAPAPAPGRLPAGLWLLGVALGAAWCFPATGYRGVLALLGAVALLLPLAGMLRGLRPGGWVVGLGLGALAAAAVAGLGWWLPKGAYIAYSGAWAITAALLVLARRHGGAGRAELALAGFVGVLAGLVAVGIRWSEAGVPASSLGVAAGLALVALWSGRAAPGTPPAWPTSLRWQAQLLAALMAVAAVVAVFGGGNYMGKRLSESSQDGQGRWVHWQHALGQMEGADWLLGKGLGRFWANQLLSSRPEDQTGDYRLLPAAAGHPNPTVVLTSGLHEIGFSEVLRLSQRVAPPAPGAVQLSLDLRTEQGAKLEAEVCAKHLLYQAECVGHQVELSGAPGRWQHVVLALGGDTPQRGAWFAPRLVSFSIGLGHKGNRIEMKHLRLTDRAGRQMLVNGDFEQGLAHWYFSSDRYHLPWHLKNLAMHLLFEQGVFGLLVFALLAGAALWRTSVGAARRHALAPVLAAAIAGVLVIGAVDSLLDMPRIAFLTLWLMAVAVALPADGPR